MFVDNGVLFEITTGQVLVTAILLSVIALHDHSPGQVLVIGNIGLLVDYGRGRVITTAGSLSSAAGPRCVPGRV